ncbi:MAG TPA: hypothetical protein ENI87_03340, partial [bacterium]|nr:hypothetical protein [bacterium]
MSRLSLRVLLRGADKQVVQECVQRWCPDASGKPVLGRASNAMEDEALVLQRIGALPRKLQDLLEVFFGEGGAVRDLQGLFR